ncbi:MAG: DUF4136 domain-containing protein [Microscillaceae bacterium]|nr:DUF4136 domain-containing protein [Microscillaceae bacterium]
MILYIISILLVFQNCSPRFKVGSDLNPGANFNNFQTFSEDRRELFTKRSNPILNSEITKKKVYAAIAQALETKGYTRDDKNPDLIFNFQTAIRSRQDVQTVNNGPVWGGYWSRWNNPFYNQTYVRDYEEVTMIVDILDNKTKELIWQGWVIGEMNYTSDDWNREINTSILKALENFPGKK